jgi:leucyl-tRNA synthetase
MPGWAGSSWYFLRYMDPKNSGQFASKQLTDYWQNVDLYIGGSEHATGHLLYVRFWTKFLNDLGLIGVDEPAKKLINQGMIQGRSNFVYRAIHNIGGFYSPDEDSDKISASLIPAHDYFKKHPIFISKKIVDLYIKDDQEAVTYVNAKISEIELNARKIVGQFNGNLSIMHLFNDLNVDVNIVSNDILDKEAFFKWRSDFKDAIFITEKNGDYICGVEIEKMSKSKFNVVSPDDICQNFGADTLRLYEMFLGPLEQSKPWNTNGITGVSGFLKKLWKLFYQNNTLTISDAEASKAELKTLHKTIKKITEDIERFSFNTSVSNFMICVNELTEQKCNKRAILEPLLVLVSPYAPHIAEELWSQIGHTESIAFAKFPECNEAFLVEDSFMYPISFNGKMRFNIELPATLTVPEIEKEVMSREEVQKYLEGKTPKKIIIVPKKIVNFVV